MRPPVDNPLPRNRVAFRQSVVDDRRCSLHVRPDAFVDRREARHRENVLHVARPRDRDRMVSGDVRGPPRQHQRAVAERNCLSDVVGYKDDGLGAEIPQPEQIFLELGAGRLASTAANGSSIRIIGGS
jgi:hypothetical protein